MTCNPQPKPKWPHANLTSVTTQLGKLPCLWGLRGRYFLTIIILYLWFVKIEIFCFLDLLDSFKVRCLDLVCFFSFFVLWLFVFILFDTLLIFFVGMLLCFLLMCVFEFGFFDGVLYFCCFVGVLD